MAKTPVSVPATHAMTRHAMPSFNEAFRFWLKLGFINFGGPAGQIAIMHRELVDRRRWIEDVAFLRALNFCMLLPGPEAQQLAIYIGWRLHGIVGGVIAGLFFVLPSVFVLLLLSFLAVAYADLPAIAGLFYGIQPVVIAVVFEAVLRIGKRTLHHPVLLVFAVCAFVAIRLLGVAFPFVILAAGFAGILLYRWYPHIFQPRTHGAAHTKSEAALLDEPEASLLPSLRRNVLLVNTFLVLWLVPVGALWSWRGTDDVLFQQAIFFTRAAFVTFGGAYAVLAYIADQAVQHYHWLTASQMVQGLGLAESTPGPLIMVTQFVGFVGAWNHPGEFSPVIYGTLGALITTYVTFLPCFLFIFLGAPYIETLGRNRRLQAALAGVTAAIVGVIANLGVFFAGNVLFPDAVGIDLFAIALAVGSFILLQRWHIAIHWVVLLGAVLGLVWTLILRG